MSAITAPQDTKLKLEHRHASIISQRAAHLGFLCFAVKPQAYPDGFVAYFLSTLSMTGDDSRSFGRIHAYARRSSEDIEFQAGTQHNCHEPGVLRAKITSEIGLLADMLGPESYDGFLRCMDAAHVDAPNFGSVGMYGSEARFFARIGDDTFPVTRGRVLYQLGCFAQRCRDGEGIFSGTKEKKSVVLHNLLVHVHGLVPS